MYAVPTNRSRSADPRSARPIPVALAAGGNITVYFDVLSYAGTLTVTAIVDPDRFPDLGALTNGLRAELDLIIHASAIPG